MDTWGPHTTQELFTRIRESMPPENPNGLSADTYASIVAFLLKANGAQAGSSAFTPETSVAIASIANGQMPASLTAAAAAPARGRGRGGRGRAGDDDSTATARAAIGSDRIRDGQELQSPSPLRCSRILPMGIG